VARQATYVGGAVVRGSVVKRPWKDGKRISYAIKFRLPDGRQKLETIGPNKKQAERVLARRLEELYGGTYRELKQATFGQFAAKWLAEYAEPRLKRSTADGYRRYFENHLNPAFGAYPLASITTGQIQEFMATALASGRSGKTVNNYLVPLRKMLSDAVSWGFLTTNPAADVQRARVVRKEMAALTPEQVRRLLAAAEPEYELLFRVAIFTGVRSGELLALQWRDVDWQRAQLCVRRSVWKGHISEPKSARGVRRIDLGPDLLATLRSAKSSSGHPNDLIFTNRNGSYIDPRNLVQRHFEPTLKRAGLPHVRFHDLRHTFASLLIAQGRHPKAIQDQLGHASIQTTLDRYGHLLPGVHEHGGAGLEALVSEDESSGEAAA
jgi:integrase